MILMILISSLILATGVSSQCTVSYPIRLSAFEENFVYSDSGCTQYFVGPFNANQDNLLFSFSYNQLNCSKGQNIQIRDDNSNLVFDLCQVQQMYFSSIYSVAFKGSYVSIFFYNVAGSSMSSFVHYNKFDKINDVPPKISANVPTTPTTTPTTTTTTTAATTTQSFTCGVQSVLPKIVGGVAVNPYSWPWQVLLTIDRNDGYAEFCSGSLISNEWIVTAAHCIKSSKGMATLGLYDQADVSQSTAIPISKAIIHPSYNSATVKNDIALVKLSQPVTFSNKINSICLTGLNIAGVGATAVASGWGDTSYGGQLSKPLLQVSIPIQSMSWCALANTDSTTQICAGDTTYHKGVCQGDSGGPLVVKSGSLYYLAGVTSMSDGGCTGKSVFTRVSNYYNWIMSTISSN